jgi:hypothetical protein
MKKLNILGTCRTVFYLLLSTMEVTDMRILPETSKLQHDGVCNYLFFQIQPR